MINDPDLHKTFHGASFKDPSARVFFLEDDELHIYRELDPDYLPHYKQLISSGLSSNIIEKKQLIPFEEIEQDPVILRARKIPFVSYPYEWTFTQWKDAALLTLKIQYQALQHGMILKDASPFNIIFEGSHPWFIDISSFEIYEEGMPWKAFKQFSENFYITLLLYKYYGSIANDIYRSNIHGISLSRALPLLPLNARLNFSNYLYLAMPEKIRRSSAGKKEINNKKINRKSSLQFTEQLFNNINSIKKRNTKTKWNDYYESGVTDAYLSEKEHVIKQWLGKGYENKQILDAGCNNGYFSILLSSFVKKILAMDEDASAVDDLYNKCKTERYENIFPFYADISQPSPAVGFGNNERDPLISRLNTDAALALALVHHLVFTYNISFEMIAAMFAGIAKELVIEFIPKEDEKIRLLLQSREDIFPWYNESHFILSFEKRFSFVKKHTFSNKRILFHFSRL